MRSRHRERLLLVVCHVDEGDADLALHAASARSASPCGACWSSAPSGSSSSTTVGPVDNGAGEGHALALAAGQLRGLAVRRGARARTSSSASCTRLRMLGLRRAASREFEGDVLERPRGAGRARSSGRACSRSRLSVGTPVTTSPAELRSHPALGLSKPAIMRMSVVLPQPEGPEDREELVLSDLEVERLHDGDSRRTSWMSAWI